MKKWVRILALLATIVAFGTVGVLGLTVVNQSRENSDLQEQLNVARQETRLAMKLARRTQRDIAKLLKRQNQLTNFIRRHGFEPPPVDQRGQSGNPGNDQPDPPPNGKPKPPKDPPKPGPSPSPSPEECLAEVLGVCV